MLLNLIARYLASAPPEVRRTATVTMPRPVPKGTVLFQDRLYCREHPNVFVGHTSKINEPDKHFPCPFC